MAVAIDMPDMRDAVSLEEMMHALADTNQSIFIAASDEQQLQILFGGIDVGDQRFGCFGS